MSLQFNPFTGTFDVTTKGDTGTVTAAGDGTAALPGIAFASDTNTGIYRPDADALGFSTAGTPRLYITATGLIGAGTTSPQTLIEGRIAGAGNLPATSGTSQPNAVFRVSGSGTTGVLDIGCNSGAPWIQATDRTDLSQKYNLLLNPRGGNVGIGLAGAAGTALDVRGTSGSLLNIQGSNVSGNSIITTFKTGNNGRGLEISGDYTTETWTIANYYNSPLAFGTNNQERVRITADGEFLVGTNSNSGGSLLQVNGNRIRVSTAKTPASATDTGTTGEICWDANYIYVCTATNTWKRTALATW